VERAQLLAEVNTVFAQVLAESGIRVMESTTAEEVEAWDSLNHIRLVVAVESHFKIRFSSREIRAWKNVGEMLTCIQN